MGNPRKIGRKRIRLAAEERPALSYPPTRNNSNPSYPKSVPPTQKGQPIDKLLLALSRISYCADTIKVPAQRALKQALDSGNKLGDPQLAKKATQKFHRIFGEMFSAIDLIKGHLDPLIEAVKEAKHGQLDRSSAKQIVTSLSAALPMLQAGFKTLNPQSHESAVADEIQKQERLLKQMEEFFHSNSGQNPQVQAKLKPAIELANYYIENLKGLADPEYADRIAINVDRALHEHIPASIEAAKELAKSFGAREKAASIRKSQKRMQQVTKRIVLLAYLRSKSL